MLSVSLNKTCTSLKIGINYKSGYVFYILIERYYLYAWMCMCACVCVCKIQLQVHTKRGYYLYIHVTGRYYLYVFRIQWVLPVCTYKTMDMYLYIRRAFISLHSIKCPCPLNVITYCWGDLTSSTLTGLCLFCIEQHVAYKHIYKFHAYCTVKGARCCPIKNNQVLEGRKGMFYLMTHSPHFCQTTQIM